LQIELENCTEKNGKAGKACSFFLKGLNRSEKDFIN